MGLGVAGKWGCLGLMAAALVWGGVGCARQGTRFLNQETPDSLVQDQRPDGAGNDLAEVTTDTNCCDVLADVGDDADAMAVDGGGDVDLADWGHWPDAADSWVPADSLVPQDTLDVPDLTQDDVQQDDVQQDDVPPPEMLEGPDVVLAQGPRLYSAVDGMLATAQGQRLSLRGLNVDNAAKYLPGFMPPISDAEIAGLPQLGVNLVRLLTFWNALTPTAPGQFDGVYLDSYVALVHKVAAAGLYVVVDMHQDLWGPPFEVHGAPNWACPDSLKQGYVGVQPWWANYLAPQVTACFDQFWASEALQEQYAATWGYLAQQVCDVPEVIGFDLMNEPFAGSLMGNKQFESVALFGLYKRVIQAIEQACPGRLYFLEHSWTFSVGNYKAMPLEPGLKDSLVFSPHYYRPELHELDGEGYGQSEAALFQALDNLWSKYLTSGWTLWLGEFGGYTHLPGYGLFMEHMHRYFQARDVGSALYGWGKTDDGFSFVNSAGQLKPIFAPVYATPLPSLLPGLDSHWQTDFATGEVTALFTCAVGDQAVVLLPNPAACQCAVQPEQALTHDVNDAPLQTWTCLDAGPVQFQCACSG